VHVVITIYALQVRIEARVHLGWTLLFLLMQYVGWHFLGGLF